MMHVEERTLVTPGQLIAEGDYEIGEGVFWDGDQVRASQMGLVDKRGNNLKIIPLEGRYIPQVGDKVLGVVIDTYYSGWVLDINAPYEARLSVSDYLQRRIDLYEEDISEYLEVGDVVEARISELSGMMDIDLEVSDRERGKVTGGRMIEISPSRIPRVIGRKGSMISVIQDYGNCKLSIGQNGRIIIWADSKPRINKVVEAILMIEREAHTSGLTDRVKKLLEKYEKGG
ncbi:MAG: exosome complex RNA-binding protein Rrp4 [Candidatus Hadarchaeia archaeon]